MSIIVDVFCGALVFDLSVFFRDVWRHLSAFSLFFSPRPLGSTGGRRNSVTTTSFSQFEIPFDLSWHYESKTSSHSRPFFGLTLIVGFCSLNCSATPPTPLI
jgi:hypothetical protein